MKAAEGLRVPRRVKSRLGGIDFEHDAARMCEHVLQFFEWPQGGEDGLIREQFEYFRDKFANSTTEDFEEGSSRRGLDLEKDDFCHRESEH